MKYVVIAHDNVPVPHKYTNSSSSNFKYSCYTSSVQPHQQSCGYTSMNSPVIRAQASTPDTPRKSEPTNGNAHVFVEYLSAEQHSSSRISPTHYLDTDIHKDQDQTWLFSMMYV